ncbi:MAG: hypothetical protein R6U04_01115 [Bacteroidales bacterium]
MVTEDKEDWDLPTESDENPEEKQVCPNCGNDTFRVYITRIIDDARLYCVKCGKFDL